MGMQTTVHDVGEAVDVERVSTLDTLHRALADSHRRFVLRDLVAHFHPQTVSDVVARAGTDLYESADETVYRALERSFCDEHLPFLEAAGLVQFAGERVELTADGLAAARFSRACSVYVEESVENC